MSKRVIILSIVLGCFSYFSLFSQTVTIKAEKYKHVFEGVGTSIGLYAGHHWSMDSIGQDSAIRLINKDCNMMYLQDYTGHYPEDKPSYFDKRSDYFKDARKYRPDNKVSIVVNKFPDNLMKDEILDVERDSIYYDVADWYFQVIKGFKDRDVDVDILNLVNEPDYKAAKRYGYGNAKVGIGYLLKEAIPILRSMINDTSLNKIGMKMPLVMAASTLGVGPCLNWVKYFKIEDFDAWEQIDIVSTHQYNHGFKQHLFEEITDSIEGKPFFQSEMHTNRGDGLGDLPIENPHRGCLSFARVFSASVNGGLNAWFYFENNYPQDFHPGGLIRVAWKGKPRPYKHYYAFKQMSSTQPVNSHVLENDIDGFSDKTEVLTFRKLGEDTVFLNLSNFNDSVREIKIFIEGDAGNYKMKALQAWSTDANLDGKLILNETYTEAKDSIIFTMEPYSVNTLKIVFDGSNKVIKEQTLTFEQISSIGLEEDYVVLDADLSSGLDVQYKLVKGNATISNDTVYINRLGLVRIKAYHPGNDTILPSNIIVHSFCVQPEKPIFTFNKDTLVSNSLYESIWRLNGRDLKDATDSIYVTKDAGKYAIKVTVDGCSNISDEITKPLLVFDTIIDKEYGVEEYVILEAEISNELEVEYELESGSAVLLNDTVYLDEIGSISIKAFHPGNDTLIASNIISQSFCVVPPKPVVTEKGDTLISSSTSNNQWLLDGSYILNATLSKYIPEKSGDYAVKVTVNGCSNTSDEVSVIYTGIDKGQINSQYIINMNYNELLIQRKDNFNIRSVHLYNINGVKVIERNDIFSNSISIGLDNITNGIYMLKIVDDKGNYIVRKISKL